MTEMSATQAKNKFGQMLEAAQAEPVRIQKNGRDVAIVVSPEQFLALQQNGATKKVRPVIDELMARSIERRKSLYEALAR